MIAQLSTTPLGASKMRAARPLDGEPKLFRDYLALLFSEAGEGGSLVYEMDMLLT